MQTQPTTRTAAQRSPLYRVAEYITAAWNWYEEPPSTPRQRARAFRRLIDARQALLSTTDKR